MALFCIVSLISGCGLPRAKSEDQNLKGLIGSSKTAFPVPQTKPKATIQQVKLQLAKSHVFAPAPHMGPSLKKERNRHLIGQTYLKALEEVEGLPRSQGEDLFRELVSPKAEACGGTSCAKVFGIETQEVDHFFDDLLQEVTSEPRLVMPTPKPLRKVLIGSLKEDDPAQAQKAAMQEHIATIYEGIPITWPATPKQTPPIYNYDQITRWMGPDVVRAIEDYTAINYRVLRDVETSSDQELIAKGMRKEHLTYWRNVSEHIDQALRKPPRFDAVVYRGLQDISDEQIDAWIEAWKKGTAIGLGPSDRPAVTSATWDPKIARDFINRWVIAPLRRKFGVLLVIKNHQGVSIEKVSLLPNEKEVLLPRGSTFKIESMTYVKGERKVLCMVLSGQ